MPATEQSPLDQLVTLWRGSERKGDWSVIAACRSRLYTAAVHEITMKAAASTPFDPMMDPRFKWCLQWLEVWEGTRRTIDREIEMHCHLKMDPIPLSRRLLSAGDIYPEETES